MNKERPLSFHEVRHIQKPKYPWFDTVDQLDGGVLYVVDGDQQDRDQLVEYNCPCGCGETVMIPYYRQRQQKEESPSWAYREENGKVTLQPSIYSTGFSCRAHCFIRDNQIVWC